MRSQEEQKRESTEEKEEREGTEERRVKREHEREGKKASKGIKRRLGKEKEGFVEKS